MTDLEALREPETELPAYVRQATAEYRQERERRYTVAPARNSQLPHAMIATPETFSAGALMREKFAPVSYVVPGYLAEGATILAGRPKLGKSWMALEMAVAVASGGACLGGIECEQGDVLYLALEDNKRRLQSRLQRILPPGRDWQERLHLATEWPRASAGGLTQIRAWLDQHKSARLVIVDVMAMFRDPRGAREQLYDGDYSAIKGLQALAMEKGVAILIVHHTRKGGAESGDAFEKVSGTLGLSGAADTTLVLDRDSNGCTLYGRGRDIPEIETAVRFDKESCRWSALGEAVDVRRTDERAQVLKLLSEADEPMTPVEIAGALGACRNAIKQRLFKMAKAGEVDKALCRRGAYIHPERRDLDTPVTAGNRPSNRSDNRPGNREEADGAPVTGEKPTPGNRDNRVTGRQKDDVKQEEGESASGYRPGYRPDNPVTGNREEAPPVTAVSAVTAPRISAGNRPEGDHGDGPTPFPTIQMDGSITGGFFEDEDDDAGA